jgi:hypothetical protein
MTVLQTLKQNVAGADSIGKRQDGRFVLRRGFYFRHGFDADIFKSEMMHQIKQAGLSAHCVDHGEVIKAFNGGASVANSSHWYVVVEITS